MKYYINNSNVSNNVITLEYLTKVVKNPVLFVFACTLLIMNIFKKSVMNSLAISVGIYFIFFYYYWNYAIKTVGSVVTKIAA